VRRLYRTPFRSNVNGSETVPLIRSGVVQESGAVEPPVRSWVAIAPVRMRRHRTSWSVRLMRGARWARRRTRGQGRHVPAPVRVLPLPPGASAPPILPSGSDSPSGRGCPPQRPTHGTASNRVTRRAIVVTRGRERGDGWRARSGDGCARRRDASAVPLTPPLPRRAAVTEQTTPRAWTPGPTRLRAGRFPQRDRCRHRR
jgi:hypothetical protein